MPSCAVCGGDVIWKADFDYQDFGIDRDGIVSTYKCLECGAQIDYYIDFEDQEVEEDPESSSPLPYSDSAKELMHILAQQLTPLDMLRAIFAYEEYVCLNLEAENCDWTPQSLWDFFHEEVEAWNDQHKEEIDGQAL